MTTENRAEPATAQADTASGEGGQARDQGQAASQTGDRQVQVQAEQAQAGYGQGKTQAGKMGHKPENPTPADAAPAVAKPTDQNPKDQQGQERNQAGQTQTDQQGQAADQNPPDRQSNAPQQAAQPADYTIDLPRGAKADSLTNWFENHAKANGLSKDQAQAVYDGWTALTQGAHFINRKARELGQNQLKAEWQKDYEANVALAARAARQVGGEELSELLARTGMESDPVVLKVLNRIGKALSEDAFIAGGGGLASGQAANPAELVYPNHRK